MLLQLPALWELVTQSGCWGQRCIPQIHYMLRVFCTCTAQEYQVALRRPYLDCMGASACPEGPPDPAVQVPQAWKQVSSPSLQPLGSWMEHYHRRVAFMRGWLTQGMPKCFWLPGFFFPQGLLTGVLQTHARRYSIPIDTLSFAFKVTQWLEPGQVTEVPQDGLLIDGLWIDGARWNMEHRVLDDAKPGVMYSQLPVTEFTPVKEEAQPANQYSTPVYKTSERAGALSTTGQSTNFVLEVNLPIREGTNADYWILQGVALLTMLDT